MSVNGCHCQSEMAGQLTMMYWPAREVVFSFLICSSTVLPGWTMTLLRYVR